MKSLEQIAHSTERGFNYAVETESEGGLQLFATRTGQGHRIREVH
jgi:hypothetical protein